ncbi:MAG: selenocysteine-specific translation elongation factor [Myxococcota bacterium]|nr:selenocysteine-specific translation elongation factor [Myxococcota bacterium]
MSVNQSTAGVVLGTAGHVDHGKSTLVRDLTGMETDRLEEEQSRGISIELGFAWCDVPEVGRVAFVDVPGHERFVRRMIAGAAGIDGVIFVVAADEGVMPQTREHLDICELLGVSDGLVVLTKTDLVDAEWLELVTDDLASTLEGTFLADAPVATFAHGDDEAIERVRGAVTDLSRRAHQRRAGQESQRRDRPFKLSVDRVFTMRGFGTVVTGTSQTGVISVGEPVQLLPGGETARVRGLQHHGEDTDEGGPGTRLAVNLQGLDRDAVRRGEVLTTEDGVPVVSMFDARIRIRGHLREAPSSGARVLVHVGTAQIEGTLTWIGEPPVMPMAPGYVQLRLDQPQPVIPGESFVLRGFDASPDHGRTIGGGVVLTPALRRHRRSDAGRLQLLTALTTEGIEGQISALVERRGEEGVFRSDLPQLLARGRGDLERVAESLIGNGTLILGAGLLLHESAVTVLAERAQKLLADFHQRRPAHGGMGAEELRTRVRASLDPEVFSAVLAWMADRSRVRVSAGVVALGDFTPRRSPGQRAACGAVLEALTSATATPPRLKDLPETLALAQGDAEEAVQLLIQDGSLTRINQDLAYASSVLSELAERLESYLLENEWIDTSAFKELTGASRKWSIPLLEHFDRVRLTVRVGDRRRLRVVQG